MKTGNPKQAVVLGVLAAGALCFLGSTIFSTFATGSTPEPAANNPRIDHAIREPEAKVAEAPVNVEAAEESGAASEKLPVVTPDVINEQTKTVEAPPRISKTPFGKGKVVQTVKPPSQTTSSSKPKPNRGPGGDDSFDDERVPPTNPFAGQGTGLPNAAEGSTEPKTKAEPPKTISIRFEGYVNAGNPVAIIRIGDSQYTADQGEGLPNGIRIIAITPEKLTLSIKGRQKSIWIGREVQL
jgi:hypothetical protein